LACGKHRRIELQLHKAILTHVKKQKELRGASIFNAVSVKFDTIEWPNGADLDPEVLYNDSTSC
jgi:hypothetical protein